MAQFVKEDTFAKVADIIATKLGIDKATVAGQASLQDLGADSLDVVEIIMKFEEDFGVEINDDDAAHLEHVQQVVDYIHDRRTK